MKQQVALCRITFLSTWIMKTVGALRITEQSCYLSQWSKWPKIDCYSPDMPLLVVGGLFVGNCELPKLQELGFQCRLQRDPQILHLFPPKFNLPWSHPAT